MTDFGVPSPSITISITNRITVITPSFFLPYVFVGLKTHKFGSVANVLAQWCTSWCHQHSGPVFKTQASIQGASCAS